MAQESTQKDYCTLTPSVQTSPIRIWGTADFSVNIKLGTDWVEWTSVKWAFNAASSIPYSNLKYEAWVNGVNYWYQNFIWTEFWPDNWFVAVNDITSKFKVDFSEAWDYIVPVTIINPGTKESYCSTDVEFKVLVAEDDETKFYIQKNTTSYLPLVLNDDSSIDLVNTKNTVAADTNVNEAYKGMIAALNESDLSNLEIKEINGEKVLFINMNGQTSIPNPGTWVFVENASGPLHWVFMTNDQLDGDNVVDSNLYDVSEAVSPKWVNLASSTVRHTTAVEVGGKTIGYAIYSEKDGINGWSYAPAKAANTTKFYIQKNTTSYLPLVLNDDNSIDLVNTKIAVAADTNVNEAYKGMIAALNESDLSNLEIKEINGEKVLFINMNGQTSIPNPGTWVFVENASGPLHWVFMTNDQLDGDNVVDSNLYDVSEAVSPKWVNLASSTVRHTTAVEVGGKTIGYAIYSEKDGINGWSYAPKAYTIIFVDEDWTTVLHTQFVTLWKTPVYNWTTPTKAADSSYTYTFKEWTPALVEVTDDATYKATYTSTAKQSWGSSSWGSSSGGSSSGGSSSSSSKSTTKTDTKTTTGDNKTTTTNDNKADTKLIESNTNANNWTTPAYNDNYSKEMNDAYQFAYKNGITTMPSIDEADMTGWLTRIAMAKMLSQYAINVLGKTPDTTKVVPNFPDVSAELDAEYNNWVTLAYQLGIMWIGIEKFRPFDLVTRAEFGTALSRMLYGLADWEWDSWYKTHLDKLMEEKIITVDTPDLQELRWYVMIMLMRSAQK